VYGNPPYVSPEQVEIRFLSNRSDLFVLGVVLYEMITGKRLYLGKTDIETLKLCHRGGISPDEIALLPRKVQPLIKRALQRDPHRRFRNAEEMKAALTDVQRQLEPCDM